MKIAERLLQIICIAMFFASNASAQRDSLVLKSRDIVVGELKSLTNGVVTIETDYSKSDFTIEWSGIKEIYSRSFFLVILGTGQRLNGPFESIAGTDSVIIKDAGNPLTVSLNDIVFLKGFKSNFWSRFTANIDIGFTLQKANNLRQLNIGAAIQYLANKWQLNASYTDNRSKQDSIAQTKRIETNIDFKYFLQHDWFLLASLNFLSNTEQALKLRTTGKLGAGKFIVHTNKSYWGLGSGLSLNNESFTNNTSGRNSLEAYVGSELNLFDTKDLELFSTLYVYGSLTESNRWRSDFKLNLKYDLPWDFYIKPGFSLNYDNKPAIKGNETDYVFTFAIGWELD